MRIVLPTALLLASVAPAVAFELALPLDCTVGETCAVQHYVDRDPGGDTRDYMCGHQTYDGHDGIDIRIPDLKAMADGVDVLAAADGTVVATRDGMADRNVAETGVDAVKDVECGNGVLVAHDGGWQTQYCHMKKGSIRVAKGDAVVAGTPLGEVGLSGMTEFPHVHFTVRHGDTEVDPFALAPSGTAASCAFAGDAGTGALDAGGEGRPRLPARLRPQRRLRRRTRRDGADRIRRARRCAHIGRIARPRLLRPRHRPRARRRPAPRRHRAGRIGLRRERDRPARPDEGPVHGLHRQEAPRGRPGRPGPGAAATR